MSEFLPISKIPTKDAQLASSVEKLKGMSPQLKKGVDDKKLREAAQEFESILTFTMLKHMREAVPKSDLLKSSAEEIYQSMMDQEVTKSAAKTKGLGIADMLYRQFSQNGPKIEKNKS